MTLQSSSHLHLHRLLAHHPHLRGVHPLRRLHPIGATSPASYHLNLTHQEHLRATRTPISWPTLVVLLCQLSPLPILLYIFIDFRMQLTQLTVAINSIDGVRRPPAIRFHNSLIGASTILLACVVQAGTKETFSQHLRRGLAHELRRALTITSFLFSMTT